MINFIIAFLATILIDVCFTAHVITAAKAQPIKSAIFNSIGNLLSKSLVFLYIHQPPVVIAVLFGSFVGTYMAVKYHDKIKDIYLKFLVKYKK